MLSLPTQRNGSFVSGSTAERIELEAMVDRLRRLRRAHATFSLRLVRFVA
jgi:hypothetical protein